MAVPSISTPVLGFFRYIVRGYFRRHFHAVRISDAGCFERVGAGPLIVYANHSSWWDPMVSVLLAERYLRERRNYAPMDAASLARYGILRHIGIFPVDLQSARGGAQFLRTGLEILAQNGVVWITPQGRFADPREAELTFKPGLAALAARVPGGCTVLPLAIEYPFWNERLPETLLQVAEPLAIVGQSAAEVEVLLKSRLAGAMEMLRQKAMAREGAAFEVLQTGTLGAGGFYQLGQRMLARMRGRVYKPEHSPKLEDPARQDSPAPAGRPEGHAG